MPFISGKFFLVMSEERVGGFKSQLLHANTLVFYKAELSTGLSDLDVLHIKWKREYQFREFFL